MTNTRSTAELEDVLSSIRRLVADDARPQLRQPGPHSRQKLLLTPSLRVPDAAEPTDPEDGAALLDVPVEAAVAPQAEAPARPETGRTLQQETDETIDSDVRSGSAHAPSGPRPHALAGHDDFATADRNALSDMVKRELARVLEASPDDAPALVSQASSITRDARDDDEQGGAPRFATALEDAPAAVEDRHDDDPDESIDAYLARTDEAAGPAFDMPPDEAEPLDAMEEPAAPVDTPLSETDALSLESKIVVLEQMIGQSAAAWDTAQNDLEEALVAPPQSSIPWLDAVDAGPLDENTLSDDSGTANPQDGSAPHLSTTDVDHAPDETSGPSRADAEAAKPLPLLSDREPMIDEEVLRDMVAEIVRQELQGALGERITRNVRKLVRREIHRALINQDYE